MSTPGKAASHLKAVHYQIRVAEALDPSWSEWFGRMTLTTATDQDGLTITRLSGLLPDQVALRGILNQLWDLNLTVLAVHCDDDSSWR